MTTHLRTPTRRDLGAAALLLSAALLASCSASASVAKPSVSTGTASPSSSASTQTAQRPAAPPGGISGQSGQGPGGAPPGGGTTGQSGQGPGGGVPPGGGTSSGLASSATAAYTQNGGSATKTGQSYSAAKADESAIRVTNAGTLSLTDPAVTTSGDTSSSDNSSFYGLNAGMLANGGSGHDVRRHGHNHRARRQRRVRDRQRDLGHDVGRHDQGTGQGAHGVMATSGGKMSLTNVDDHHRWRQLRAPSPRTAAAARSPSPAAP